MLPWFHSRRQQEAGITFPSPFSHPKSTRHNVMQELLVLPQLDPSVTSANSVVHVAAQNCLAFVRGLEVATAMMAEIGIAVDSHRSDAADSS